MDWRYNQSASSSRQSYHNQHEQYPLESDEEEYDEYPLRDRFQGRGQAQYRNEYPSREQEPVHQQEQEIQRTNTFPLTQTPPYSPPRNARESPNEPAEPEGNGKAPAKENMASWLSRTASSSQAQFAATALVSGAVVAGAIFGYQHVRRQEMVEDLKSSIPELGREHEADKVRRL